jgi:hypothetical protein
VLFALYDKGDAPAKMDEAYKAGLAGKSGVYLTPKPFTNSWGTFISGYIPVKKDGKTVGVLGADFDLIHPGTL